jgi:flavin-dependent dehydrogenase
MDARQVIQQTPGEVSVVGASAAGLFTASLLAEAGLPVKVYDAAHRLDPAPRTLIVTNLLRQLLGPLCEGVVVNEIRRFELFADGRVAAIELEQPDLVIERAALLHRLAGQAEAAGARLAWGRRFVAFQRDAAGVELVFESVERAVERGPARIAIGADGASSRLARSAGWARPETVPLVQAVVPLPGDLSPDTVRVWFRPEDTPYFYWLIPESRERAALGLIGEDGRGAKQALDRFLGQLGLVPLEFQAARIPIYCRWQPVRRRFGDAEIYLVGDAAGHVKVTTVGGIVTGFRGALGVAEAILNGGSSRELRTLKRELDLHLLIRRALHGFTQAEYSRLLDLLNRRVRSKLGAYSRDEAGKVLWQVLLNQPRFLLAGLRSLLTNGSFPNGRRAGPG